MGVCGTGLHPARRVPHDDDRHRRRSGERLRVERGLADGVPVHAHASTQPAQARKRGAGPLRIAACLAVLQRAPRSTRRAQRSRAHPRGEPTARHRRRCCAIPVPVALGGPEGPDGRAGPRAHEAAAVPSMSFDLTVVTSAGGKICRGVHNAMKCNGMRSDATECNGRRRCAPIANGTQHASWPRKNRRRAP